nr:histidine kinase dimerization/phospho-acceptor domain-containing protein [uncultured Bacteroides sp.]
MKKLLLLLLCAVSPVLLYAAPASTNGGELRDSIFCIYRSMPADTTRTEFLKHAFTQNIDEDWASELLDSALVFAIGMKDVKNEIALRYEYFRYYTFRMNSEKMDETFALLKEACYRHGMYTKYFLALHYILQLKGTRGDTEYAILESQKMREEAIRLEIPRGIFLSYITEGRAYVFARRYGKSVELYKKALELSQITAEDKLMVHGYLASSYYLQDSLVEATAHLEAERKIIDHIVKLQPERLNTYKKTILEIELMYCKIYMAKDDAHNLKRHLDEASKYYSDVSFSSTAIAYNLFWSGYYYLIKDWERCFPQFERTLSFFKGTQPMYEADIRRIMGDAYRDAKRYKEAAETYRTSVLMCDSINKATLRMNAETVLANYRIKKALLEKEIAERRFWQVAVGSALLFLILLIGGIIHFSRIRRALAKSEKEMRESYALAKAADKMKEVFLHNITNEIREPLNSVVTLSDNLCQRNDLTVEQQQEYSLTIKRNAGKLIDLIFNILDLSRLEAGMMKFNVQEYNMVQLCKDAKQMVEIQDWNTSQIDFHTELDVLIVEADSTRFMKLLSSVLISPKDVKESFRVSFTLLSDDESLKIVIGNSPLLYDEEHKENEIQHTINRLYLETFKGSYQWYKENGKQTIIITYPII